MTDFRTENLRQLSVTKKPTVEQDRFGSSTVMLGEISKTFETALDQPQPKRCDNFNIAVEQTKEPLILKRRKIKRPKTSMLHSKKIEVVGSNGYTNQKISKAAIGNALGQMHRLGEYAGKRLMSISIDSNPTIC